MVIYQRKLLAKYRKSKIIEKKVNGMFSKSYTSHFLATRSIIHANMMKSI